MSRRWFRDNTLTSHQMMPNSKVHGANMGPIWVRQDPGGSHVGPMNLAIWDASHAGHPTSHKEQQSRTRLSSFPPMLMYMFSWPMPSHYLNQYWNIVNLTDRNKLQSIFNWNSYIFIHENTFENVVWKMAAILSRPQCVNILWISVLISIVITLPMLSTPWYDTVI